MKGQRFLVILLTTALLIPMAVNLTDKADGGAPVFQASIKVLPEDISRAEQRPMDIIVSDDDRVSLLYQTFEMFYWDIYMVHSNDDGLSWSDPIRVDDALRDGNSSNDESSQMEPAMVQGPDGSINVVWEDRRGYKKDDQLFTEPVRIRFARSQDGMSFSSSVEVTRTKTINTWHAYRPDIAINQDGRMVCVWEDRNEAGAFRNIWSSYSTDDGDSWSSPVIVNTDGKDFRDHWYPRVAMYEDNVYVTWHDGRNGTSGVKPYLAISRDGGETYQEEFPLSTDTAGDAVRDYAYPVVDDEGSLFVAWHDRRTQRDEIFFTRSEDGGSTFTSDNRIFILPEEASDHNPHLHATGNGSISLVWERETPFTFNTGTLYESDIYYMNSSDGGRSWSKKLPVDDTNRYGDDRKDQKWVFSTFNNEGRALCVWMDSREEVIGANDYDIYYSRHSSSLSQVNDPPVIEDIDFTGTYGFSKVIGNASDIFTFSFIFQDDQNDEPDTGFPGIQIFRDPEGTDPVLDEWKVMERTRGKDDIYFIDGVEYYTNITISEEGEFYYAIKIKDSTGPEIITSEILEGPIIDMTMPTLEMTGPTQMEWINSEIVRCSAIIYDEGGAGVKNTTIGYKKSVKGPDNFGGFSKAKGFTRIDNDTYEAWADVRFDPGTENYIKFVARDRVNNGEGESEPINLWIDFDAPYATDPEPKKRNMQIYPNVNCSITWRDNNPGSTLFNFTGMDPETIRYAYKTTTEGFGEWMVPDGYMSTGPESYRAWAHVEFPDEGIYNSIKWKAADLVGNVGESTVYSLSVDVPENYRPVFKGSSHPGLVSSSTPHFYWDPAYDEEGDRLTYRVMLLKHPSELILTNWMDLGPRTYYDVPDSEALDPDFYILRINVTDGIGGFDIYDHVFRIIDTGTPPPEMIPEFEPFYLNSPDKLEWEPSPDDDGSMSYWIRIGSRPYHGDVVEWEDLGQTTEFDLESIGLGNGIYSLQLMCSNGMNFSRVRSGIIKISEYTLDTIHPEAHEVFKGVDGIKITEPMVCIIINNGTYGDNITVRLQGELVEKGYAYLNTSGTDTATFYVESSRLNAEDVLYQFSISIQPFDDARTGNYDLTYVIISEDGETRITSDTINVNVKNPPDTSGGDSIADGLSDFITDIFPFLEGLPTPVILILFLLVLIAIIAVLVFLGITVAKKAAKKQRDPLQEQRRAYKEIYGRDPTPEEIEAMKASQAKTEEGSIDEFIKDEPQEGAVDEETEKDLPEATETGQTIPIDKIEEDQSSGDQETDELLDRLFD